MNEYTEQVKRGAALLDRVHSGWRDEIDLATLDLADSCYCVLRQVFGHYSDGLTTIWGTDNLYRFRPPIDHGFSVDLPYRPHKWRLLQEAWVAKLSTEREERTK